MEKENKKQVQNLFEELEEKQGEKPMSDDDFDSLIAETMGKFGIDESDDDGDFEPENEGVSGIDPNEPLAKVITESVDFISQMFASRYSGAAPSAFKMEQDLKQQYGLAMKAYLDTAKRKPTPLQVLIMVAGGHAGAVIYQAIQYKQSAEKAKQAERAMHVRSTSTDPNELKRASEELKETQEGPKRRKFQLDDEGFYIFDAEGGPNSYIKQADRTEKPDVKIKAWIDQYRSQGDEWKDVNNKICKRLGYSKNNAQGRKK